MYRKRVQGSRFRGSEVKNSFNPEPVYDDLLDRDYESFCTDGGDDGCYGFALELCRRMGIDLPDYRALCEEISSQDKIVKHKDRFWPVVHAEAWDLVLIRSMDGSEYHIAVMIERGRFLQATREHGIFQGRLNHPVYRDRIEGIYRVKGMPPRHKDSKGVFL